jgi:serine/threonine protein kinase
MSSLYEYNFIPEICGIGAQTKDFLFLHEIGRGSFGIVFKVQSLVDNKIYAIKKLDLKNMKDKNVREAMDEVSILRNLDHPHIIK